MAVVLLAFDSFLWASGNVLSDAILPIFTPTHDTRTPHTLPFLLPMLRTCASTEVYEGNTISSCYELGLFHLRYENYNAMALFMRIFRARHSHI